MESDTKYRLIKTSSTFSDAQIPLGESYSIEVYKPRGFWGKYDWEPLYELGDLDEYQAKAAFNAFLNTGTCEVNTVQVIAVGLARARDFEEMG